MANATVVWTIPPEAQLIPNLDLLDQRIKVGIGMIANQFAQKMQGEAQSGAPWNDVSGAARQGLRGTATVGAAEAVIHLMHSVHYGVYLELGTYKMAPRPIIMPTLQANYSPVMAAVRALLAA
jgi:hypothetical protein